ncbi:hypothetical protein GCM10027591_02710 [Zhihengliuella somnathii]
MDFEAAFDAVAAGQVPATDRLRAARILLDGVFDEVGAMDAEELVTAFRACEDLGRMTDALRVRFTGEADQRSAPALGDERLSAQLGCRTVNELLARLVQAPWAEISKRRRLDSRTRLQISLTGQPLPPKRPAIADALRTGRIGVASADHIADMLESTGNRAHPEDTHAAEESLVGLASGTLSGPEADGDAEDPSPEDTAPEDSPGQLADADAGPGTGAGIAPPMLPTFRDVQRVAKEWHRSLDPDGPEPEFRDAMKHRGLSLKAPVNGLVPLDGMLLPEVAARLHRLFSAINNPAAASSSGDPHAQDVNLTPEGEPVPRDERTPAQRNHDAFNSILDATARTAEIPTLGGDNATLVVHMDARDLGNPHGTVTYDGIEIPGSVETAHRLSCTAALQKILFTDGEVTAIGTKERTFNAHQRRAITARDGGCIIPGCGIPATWCELHHVTPWKNGGRTHVDNGVLLCWFHHHTIETSGWRIRMIKGVPYVKAPDWLDSSGTYRSAPNYNTKPRGPGHPATTDLPGRPHHGPGACHDPVGESRPEQSTNSTSGTSPTNTTGPTDSPGPTDSTGPTSGTINGTSPPRDAPDDPGPPADGCPPTNPEPPS